MPLGNNDAIGARGRSQVFSTGKVKNGLALARVSSPQRTSFSAPLNFKRALSLLILESRTRNMVSALKNVFTNV